MKLIIKQKEPAYLTNHRLLSEKNSEKNYKNFCYEVGLGDIHPPTDFRKYLLDEQGYLCAYCMRRIPHKHIEKKIAHDNMKIEHWTSQKSQDSIDKKLDITHANMFACCMGNQGQQKRFQTCDTHKGDDALKINPTDKLHIQTIKYGFDGSITSTDFTFDNDLNKFLNLNDF